MARARTGAKPRRRGAARRTDDDLSARDVLRPRAPASARCSPKAVRSRRYASREFFASPFSTARWSRKSGRCRTKKSLGRWSGRRGSYQPLHSTEADPRPRCGARPVPPSMRHGLELRVMAESLGIVGYDSFHFIVERPRAGAAASTPRRSASPRSPAPRATKVEKGGEEARVFGAGQIRVLVSTPARPDSRAAR